MKLLALLFAVSANAAEPPQHRFMSDLEIKKQALSKEKPKPKQMFVPYVPLSDIISPEEQKRIDKKKSRTKDHSCNELRRSLWDLFNPSAHAMGCSPVKPDPEPLPSPKPSPSPSVAPSPVPTPSIVPSVGVDRRDCDTPVKTQIGPLCTAWGSVSAIENLRCKGGNLSEKHVWSWYKQYSSEAAVNATSKAGRWITTEEYWPGQNNSPYTGYLEVKNTRVRAASWRYLEDSISEVMKELDKGHPVKVAHSVSRDEANCREVIRWDPNLNPDTGGGHDVTAVGYKLDPDFKGGGYLIVKNSWGSVCHDKGFAYLSFGYCQRPSSYCLFWALTGIEER